MSHVSTVLGQILKMIPRQEFETLANQQHTRGRFRTAPRWSQFAALTIFINNLDCFSGKKITVKISCDFPFIDRLLIKHTSNAA